MKTIKLHGSLGKKYGKTHRLDVKSPAEAVRALSVLHKGFEKDIREGFWQITTRRKGSNKRSPVSIDTVDMNVGGAHEIHFTPKPAVAGIELIIIGGLALLAVAAAVFALSAIPPAADDPNDRSQEENGFLFDGPVNVTEQGHPIPIVYGKVKTGSIVASAGLETTDFNSSTLPSYGGVGNGYGGSTGGWDRDPFTTTQIFKGGKSGGSQERSPDDQSSLNSESVARILDIIHDGEWEPALPGLQWVEFDEVPVENSDGTFNHSGVNVETTPGLPDQDYISGHGFQENTVAVDTEVSIQSGAIERSISDPDVTRARVAIRLPGLSQRDPEDGALKRVPTSGLSGQAPRVRILVQPTGTAGFAVEHDYTFRGLAAGPYVKDFNVNLPAGGAPWTIRVERMTPDSTDSLVQNGTEWNTLTSIIDAKLRYPNTALVGLTVSARQFGSKIPRRGYFIKGAKVQVPTNYNPETRVYTGEWDGTFKKAWTDNPAWVYYDLVTNERYGLGKFLKNKIDKWGLYAISQYNDVLVDDGFGGQEPRFTCNLVINKRDKAYKVLNALASSFRAISFWAHNEIQLVQDAPADPEVLIGPSNVIDGTFKYAGGIERTKKYSQFIITWNDPAEGYRQNYEVVEDTELLRQIGPKANTVAAYGCTSRGQARRMGRWLREDQKYNGGLDYTAGPDHSFVPPGKIVKVNDPDFVGQRWTGRILNSTASTTSIDLDAPVTLEAGTNYNVSVVLPDGSVETRAVTTAAGEVSTLDFAALTASPVKYAVWSLESSATVARQFRVARVKEKDVDEYQVSAGLFDPNKFARVEQNLMLEPSNYLGVPTGPILPPNSISVEEFILRDGENTVPSVLVGWEPARDARVTDYEAQVQLPGSEDFIALIGGETFNRTLEEVTQGTYTFRVRSKNGLGQTGPWRESSAFTLEGPAASLPEVQSLAYIRDNDALTTTLIWSKPADVRPLKYEVLKASVNDFSLAVSIGLTSDQEFTVSTAGHYWVRTAYIDQRSTAPAYLQITAAELPQPDYSRVTNAPQNLAELDAIANSRLDTLDQDILDAETARQLIASQAQSARDTLESEAQSARDTLESEAETARQDIINSTSTARAVIQSELDTEVEKLSRVQAAIGVTGGRIKLLTVESFTSNHETFPGTAPDLVSQWSLVDDAEAGKVLSGSVENINFFKVALKERTPCNAGDKLHAALRYRFEGVVSSPSGTGRSVSIEFIFFRSDGSFYRRNITGNNDNSFPSTWSEISGDRVVESDAVSYRPVVFVGGDLIGSGQLYLDWLEHKNSQFTRALIVEETSQFVSDLNAETQRIDALTSRVTTTEGDVTTIESDITSLETTKADASALTTEAQRIDALTSRVTTTEGDVTTIESDITSLETTKADASALTAEASRLSRVQASLGHRGGRIKLSSSESFSYPLGSWNLVNDPDAGEVLAGAVSSTNFHNIRTPINSCNPGDHIFASLRYRHEGEVLGPSRYIALELFFYRTDGTSYRRNLTGNGSPVSSDWVEIGGDHVAESDVVGYQLAAFFGGGLSGSGFHYLDWMQDHNSGAQYAAVKTLEDAFIDSDGNVGASWEKEVTVPGAEAFIRARATADAAGNAAATVGIGADVFSIFVPAGAEWKNAIEVSGNQIRANVTLQAGAGIFVGPSNALWQVALRSEFFYETDGAAIDFGFDLGDYDVVFSTEGLDTLLSGETYVLRAINKTGTGFTADLKITTAGTPTTVTENTNATSPSGPDHMVAKADTEIASNDIYKFYASGSITVTAFDEGGFGGGGGFIEYFGGLNVRLWFHDGTSWVDAGTFYLSYQQVGINPTHTNGNQTYTFTNKLIRSENWTGTIRSSSSLGCFAAEEDGGNSITDLNRVTYQKAGSSGTRSATPNGELATIQVIPK